MSNSSNHRRGNRFQGLRDLERTRRRNDRAGADDPEAGANRPRTPAEERLAALTVPRRGSRPAAGQGERPLGKRSRRLLIGVNIVVALCLVAGLAAFGYVDYQLGRIDRVSVPELTAASSSGPLTFLIVGSDSRSLGSGGSSSFGSSSQVSGQRSDTIMLVRVVPATSSMTILSIPRDLWVSIKGIGDSKINAAFDSGPNLLVSTIQDDLGIPINHYIEFNFDSFRDITDAVGGVKFWFPTKARDLYSLLSVPQGCVLLDGNQALAFARSRHYEYYQDGQWIEQGLSDLARIQRQQAFTKKMIAKAETKFTDPFAANRIVTSVAKNLTVDKGFSATLMISLAEDLRHADVAGIPTETVPTENYYPEGAYGPEALSLQQPQARQVIAAFNALGTPKTKTVTTAVAPSSVSVEVANGSGINGQAAQAAASLAKVGYKTTVTNDSPGYGFTGNEIEYAPDSLTAARQLAARLPGGATLVESTSLAPTPYNVELITGADYAAPGSHATASAPATTTTTYLLPGPAPTPAELAGC